MKIFAIGDLHLPGGDNKPMDVFGAHWEGHFSRIAQDWQEKVSQEDLVLIPGDISWAMQLESALEDLRMIGKLPGKKIILRGNHDYWWCGINRLRDVLPENMYAIQNDAMRFGDTVICGTRGWTLPQGGNAEDEKIYNRELIRMELSLSSARKLGGERLVVMTHYPPLAEGGGETPMSRLLNQYEVDDAVYGHLHGASLRGAVTGKYGCVQYHCVSCDGLKFRMYALPGGGEDKENGEEGQQNGG
ncbi:MAG: metallophosphoesterase [Clostridia bacterium]|nr:metallophosphoesterase [Clostridia bacterium]